MNLFPTHCNLCNGKVIFTSNSLIYGKEYGSGKMYYCTNCGAYVGTHIPRPREAFGILANKQMRDMKKKCHELFDERWLKEKNKRKSRQREYSLLADYLHIPVSECHFGYFNLEQLKQAYSYLQEERR